MATDQFDIEAFNKACEELRGSSALSVVEGFGKLFAQVAPFAGTPIFEHAMLVWLGSLKGFFAQVISSLAVTSTPENKAAQMVLINLVMRQVRIDAANMLARMAVDPCSFSVLGEFDQRTGVPVEYDFRDDLSKGGA